MEGYEVVTTEDEKVGKVVGQTSHYLIIEQGTLRKSKHAVPREFAHVDESEQQVRMSVSKDLLRDSPKLNGELDEQAIAEHYGLAASPDAPAMEGVDQAAHRAGVTPAPEERARIREGAEDSGLPQESPGLLGDRLADVDERDR
jgi:hypothetical protein